MNTAWPAAGRQECSDDHAIEPGGWRRRRHPRPRRHDRSRPARGDRRRRRTGPRRHRRRARRAGDPRPRPSPPSRVWAETTVFDSEKVADIVGDALDQPEVEAALADYLTTQVFTAVDVDAVLQRGRLPDQLQRFEPVHRGRRPDRRRAGAHPCARQPGRAGRSSRTVVERAHRRADGPPRGRRAGRRDRRHRRRRHAQHVAADRSRRRAAAAARCCSRTWRCPSCTADGDPAEQIAALSEATGRDLPDDFGQLVVYRSERLADAQASLANAQRVFALVQAGDRGCSSALVDRPRRGHRSSSPGGAGGPRSSSASAALAAMVIVRSATRRVVDDAPELAARPGGRAAIESIVSGASTGLLRLAGILLIVAVTAVVVAMFRRGWRRDDLVLVAAVVLVGSPSSPSPRSASCRSPSGSSPAWPW